jgi:hypothetical protein
MKADLEKVCCSAYQCSERGDYSCICGCEQTARVLINKLPVVNLRHYIRYENREKARGSSGLDKLDINWEMAR